MRTPKVTFFYEFASTYSYLSVVRIGDAASAAGIEVIWRPFLLGPIFKAQGWSDSPFNIYPAKGRYMVRDITRIAAERGRTFRMPATFPVNGLIAARLALAVGDENIATFTERTFVAQFERGADISDRAVLSAIIEDLGLDSDAAFAKATSPEIKDALRETSDRAAALGIFGAPSFITEDGELFWGDDRLDQALRWAQRNAGQS